jgi:pimeloyl-ACP methyl ester carboxylesterase
MLYAQDTSVWRDPSPHSVQFVTVAPDVRLEVLDWGGAGRPLVLLNGAGGTAHGFDDFAPKLTSLGHVYGITRRGCGASSAPVSGYGADRLGDDVLAVMESFNIVRPVLVGESLGGEELSSVGSRYPDRVAGLVYLDAGYQYAFDNGKGITTAELEELQRSVAALMPAQEESDRASFTALQAWYKRVLDVTPPEAELRQSFNVGPNGRVGMARIQPDYITKLLAGVQKYTTIRTPILAMFAVPQEIFGPLGRDVQDARLRQTIDAANTLMEKQAKAFEEGVPTARVVRIQHAKHLIFMSNESDVLREMREFIAGLD